MDNPEPPVSLEEFQSRLLSLCGNRGVSNIPRRLRSRLIVLKAVSLCCETGKQYSQMEIDYILRTWLASVGRWTDANHVDLRRLLIDEGLLSRTADGSKYWRSLGKQVRIQFAPEIDELDTAFLRRLRPGAETRRKEEAPRTSLHLQLMQVLRGPENVLIEWNAKVTASGSPEDRFEQLHRVGSWYFVVAPFLALLPEFVGRAINRPVHYEIEWADDTIFMKPDARAGAIITDAIYGWEFKVPVFVLVSRSEQHEMGTITTEVGVEAVAFIVPRFRMEGAGRSIKASPIETPRPADYPAFGFEVTTEEVAKAIHAAADACQVRIERLGRLSGNWRPQGLGKVPPE